MRTSPSRRPAPPIAHSTPGLGWPAVAALALGLLLLMACDDTSTVDGGLLDAGADGGPRVDADIDLEAGIDAGAGADVGAGDVDAGDEIDAGAGADAGMDLDAGDDVDGGATSDAGSGASAPLEVAFATYLGGRRFDRIQGTYIDAAGNIYLAGTTHSTDFPVTSGAFDETKSGSDGGDNDYHLSDGFVAKLSPDGGTLLWATFLGGSARDSAYGVRTDSAGNVYVSGATGSSDFPTTAGAYDRTLGGTPRPAGLLDAFLVKLSSDGTTLLFGTYLGSTLADEENVRGSLYIAEDAGLVYVSGTTSGSDFPTTSGAFQTTYGGGAHDGFVSALTLDGSTLRYSTFLGGGGSEMAYGGIGRHSDGSIYVAGATSSSDFPTTPGAYSRTLSSGTPSDLWYNNGDAFVVRLSADLGSLIFGTYLGGDAADSVAHNQGLAVVGERAVVAGTTSSSNFPTTSGAFDRIGGSASDVFVVVLDEDGGGLTASTLFGGNRAESASGLSADVGLVCVTGITQSNDLPTSADGLTRVAPGPSQDAFVAVFDTGLSELRYGSYLGGTGTGSERGRGSWIADDGRVLVVGTTDSGNFPLRAPSVDTTFGGTHEGFLIAFDPTP